MAKIRRVSEKELQSLFNNGAYWAKIQSGELSERLKKDKHPAPKFLPFCTRSQIVTYHDQNGKKIAMVHQYLKPDGTIGAFGKPDPKQLLHNGVMYCQRRKRK